MTGSYEKTLLIVKADAFRRKLSGKILARLEEKGFDLLRSSVVVPTKETLHSHYREHVEKSFFKELIDSMSSGRVMAMEIGGHAAIAELRRFAGITDPCKAAFGTIRADFGLTITDNVVHVSADAQAAEEEIKIWFGE